MKSLIYSVAIRSVRDNEFLRRTLQSLQEQTILPNEIVIAIPADTEPWETGEKVVRFVQVERGMVTQRTGGILAASNKNLLLLDDDVVLSPNTAELLLIAMNAQQADCIVPYWNEKGPEKRIIKVFLAIFGIAIPKRAGGIHYTAGGGYYYPEQEPTVPCETHGGAGAVLMINKDFCLYNNCLGDKLLQEVSVYALREDGAFILDIVQKGGKSLMVGGVSFIHLGGTTRLDPSRLEMAYVAQIYNSHLFWKNYIQPQYNKFAYTRLVTRLAIFWYLLGTITIGLLIAVRANSFQPISGMITGLKLLYKKK